MILRKLFTHMCLCAPNSTDFYRLHRREGYGSYMRRSGPLSIRQGCIHLCRVAGSAVWSHTSCEASAHMALLALGLGNGDEHHSHQSQGCNKALLAIADLISNLLNIWPWC